LPGTGAVNIWSHRNKMPSDMKISVVIPAYNEEEVIGEVVKRVFAVDRSFEVIVVDDGSSDRTAEEAEKAGARVVRNPYNVGNGATIKNGARASTGDVVVFMDGDGQHPPEQIPSLLEHIGPYDMVVGARTARSDTSRFRNVGNWGLIQVAQWITGKKIDDLTSGFRAIKREWLEEFIHLFPNGYSYPTTITIALMQSGRFVKYIPMDSIKRRETGQSNIRPFKDALKFIYIIARVIILFSPQRFFLPLSGLALAAGLTVSALQLFFLGGIMSTGVILIMSSVYIGCFGLLVEQISMLRRERR